MEEGLDDIDFEEEATEIEQPEEEPEIEILSLDEVPPPSVRRREGAERISKPFLGKLAKARLIAARAKQLESEVKPLIPVGKFRSGELNEIAKQELAEGVIPLKILRRFADGSEEVWLLSEMMIARS